MSIQSCDYILFRLFKFQFELLIRNLVLHLKALPIKINHFIHLNIKIKMISKVISF